MYAASRENKGEVTGKMTSAEVVVTRSEGARSQVTRAAIDLLIIVAIPGHYETVWTPSHRWFICGAPAIVLFLD